MQFLLIKHGVFPGELMNRPPGERLLVEALFLDYRRRKIEHEEWF